MHSSSIATSALAVALVGALFLSCAGPPQQGPGSRRPPESELQFDGTVRYIDIEGGAWVIEGEDGTTYEPIGLPEEFRQEGLPVRVWAEREEDRVSIRMVGPIISIVHIERRE